MATASHVCLTNREVSAVLREIADRLQRAGDSPFRVAAYRRGAAVVGAYPTDLNTIVSEQGVAGLRQLPGVGKSLARVTARLLRDGRSAKLERLRRHEREQGLLRTLPGVGSRLARQIEQSLGTRSLEEIFDAAHDGRLARVPGLGKKRLRAIRESLNTRLGAGQLAPQAVALSDARIADLLSIDDEYRAKAAAGRLPLATPRLFNPTGAAWLPVLRTQRRGRTFTAHFANTSSSHRLDRFRDWVVITCDSKSDWGQWTVLTANRPDLRGKRVVMHHEQACRQHYERLRTQLSLPLEG